jgi:hypothetical protein
MLLALTMTLGAVAQTSPFKYVDAEALPTAADGVQIFSFNENMLDMIPMESITKMIKKDGNSSVMANVKTLLKKLKSLDVYIASTPESIDKLQKAFAPMLTPGLHRSIKPLLVVNQPEDNLKVQIVSRESGIWCWRKCPELLISVLDEDEYYVVGLTGNFAPKDIQKLISSAFPSGK